VQWSTRFFIFLLAFCFAALTILVVAANITPTIPRLSHALTYKEVLSPANKIVYKNSLLAQKYQGFRKFIEARYQRNRQYNHAAVQPSAGQPQPWMNGFPAGIRAGFYVDWDPQSFYSLQRHIHDLNLVLPEWFFLDPVADTLKPNIDARAFTVMKRAGVAIMPMLTNTAGENFRGDVVRRIVNNPAKKERLIKDVLFLLKANHFAGVNVDFEDLEQSDDKAFVAFQKELYNRLHQEGLLVSQDIVPFNDDYDYEQLGRYNDYLFVMAYDQFTPDTRPGPIAEQRWIEGAVAEATRHLPARKIILCMGAYGYDWPVNGNSNDVATLTYQQALTNARESHAAITYDNNTYNLHYSYSDEDSLQHEVYFTDAATAFNTLRFATEANLAGTALWRLGSEDYRLWNFYQHDMSEAGLRDYNYKAMAAVQAVDDVDYTGAGEVLDVRAMPAQGNIYTELDTDATLISEENYLQLPSMFAARKYGWNGADTTRNRKKLVLTFDDGPDEVWTPQILDILSKEQVPAAFFILGINAEKNFPIVKRIYREGHEIGNHTFTHPNVALISRRHALIELEATRTLIESITGHSTILFRAPYNADFEPEKLDELLPVALARTKNYLDVGESIDPLDWEPRVTADTIFNRVVREKKEREEAGLGGNIILLHDAGGDTRKETVKALPRIIDYFKQQGYTFTTVAGYLGRSRNDVMPAIPHKGSGYYLIQAATVLFEFSYWAGHLLFQLFVLFIVLSFGRILLLGIMAFRAKSKEKALPTSLPLLKEYPLVSIIVPAYNEAIHAVSSLHNLLKTDYPNFEIIFVDDGSKDETYERVVAAFKENKQVKVCSKENGGKASALNFGMRQSGAGYFVCIDADTRLRPDAVSQLMKHFLSSHGEKVGAVAGNVKVGNEVNMLTRWQAIEYITSQNFDRRAFALVNAITVVPGAIGAFSRVAMEQAGNFSTDTLAEDCDLTIRIIRAGFVVSYENAALAYTEAPETLPQFLKQRFRWSFGILQAFWKHRKLLFNRKQGALGWLAMPHMLLFQYIIPSFIPLADVFMLVGLLTGNAGRILPYYLLFLLVDAAVALVAFFMEKESVKRLVWLLPQRLIYRWLMWWVLYKSVRRALKGELQNWGVLKRSGRVKELNVA